MQHYALIPFCSALPFDKSRTTVLSAIPRINDSTTVQNIVIIAIVSNSTRWSWVHKTKLTTCIVTWTSLNNRVQHKTNTAKIKVAVSLHLHHAPQADMLECRLEILTKSLLLWVACTFEYAAPMKGISTMMYWQMTHIWWQLWKDYTTWYLAGGVLG